MPKGGVLVVGHGTRALQGQVEFQELLGRVAEQLAPLPVAGGFLELAEPLIPEAAAHLLARGIEQLVVLPLLLFSAGHAKRDIPAAVFDAVPRDSHVQVALAEPLGCRPALLRLSEQRFRESLPVHSAEVSWLIVVGRGSSDAEATAGLHEYARRLAVRVAVPRWEVAFMAAARPRLPDALRALATEMSDLPGGSRGRAPQRTAVVLPHLLFQGDVLYDLRRQVAECSGRHPEVTWQVAGHLGPAGEVVEVLVESARAAFARLTKTQGSTH